MHHGWTKGLKGAEKEARKKQVLQYRNAFDDLLTMIRSELTKKQADRDYTTDGWVHRQIASNEYNAAIEDVVKLMNLNHKDK